MTRTGKHQPRADRAERKGRAERAQRTTGRVTRNGNWSTEAVQAREQAREEERRRLARELHDDLGHHLFALRTDLLWVQQRLFQGSPADARDVAGKLPAMLELVDRSMQTVTAIVTDLRPPALDQLGLIAALEWQTETFARRTGLRCHFAGMADIAELDMGRATAVFRMFQEMLTNVERHAEANHVRVVVSRQRNRLLVRVLDNGRGPVPKAASTRSSYGLLGMHERALLLGGTVTIKRGRRQGTIVTVTIPLANRRAQSRAAEGGNGE